MHFDNFTILEEFYQILAGLNIVDARIYIFLTIFWECKRLNAAVGKNIEGIAILWDTV